MRRPMGRVVLMCCLALAAMSASACSDDDPDTSTPTTPTTPTVTEEFTGTLTVNGANTHVFITTAAGAVTSTLTLLEPAGSPSVSLSVGTWNGTACAISIANDAAAQGAVVTGTVSTATSLCTRMSDAGRLTGSVTYTLTVVHP